MRRKVLIGVFAIALVVSAIILVRMRTTPVVRIEGVAPEFVTLHSTQELTAKPIISVPLPGGKSFDLPRPDPSLEYFEDWMTVERNVAGLLIADRSNYFTAPTWTIDRYSASIVPRSNRLFIFANVFVVPTVFGTQPLIGELKPNVSEPPIRLILPPNGRPAPILEEKSVQIDGWKISFKPRPVIANLLPFIYDVTAEGPSDNERVTLLWFGSTFNPWVLIDPKATIAVWEPEIAAVPPDPPQMLTIDFVRSVEVDLLVKRSSTSIRLLDSGKEVWRADWPGGQINMQRFDLDPPGQSLIVSPTFVLGKLISPSLGLTPPEDVNSNFEYMKEMKDGQILKARRLVYIRRRNVRIEFGFPDTKTFARSWYTD